MAHGDECPCESCCAKRARHEEAIAQMRRSCPGCRVGQPYGGGYHDETGDLYAIACKAIETRRRIDEELVRGTMLRKHAVLCDCSMCTADRRAR